MILLTYCILLTAYEGEPSALLCVMALVEWLIECRMGIRYLMDRATKERL